MYCDNQAAIYIAMDFVFHERVEYIEVDCDCIRDMVQRGVIFAVHVSSVDQATNIFSKDLAIGDFSKCCDKLGIVDIYVPT